MQKNFPVSENVARMKASSTFRAAQKAAELRAAGHDVIDLTVGEPDFDTPQFIKDFAIEGLAKGVTKYTPSSGLQRFREAVVRFYFEQFGASLSIDEVAASCGGKQALFNASCSILNPGDELLIPSPYWVTFPELGAFCGAKNVFIDTGSTGFVLTAEQVRSAITERSKLLIINSPNNPTGREIPPDELVRIVEICAEKGIYVISDECYLFFVYPPSRPFTLASLAPELRHFVCIAGSFSKTFAMTGWRSGYTIANPEWTKAMVKLQGHSASHPTSFVQFACALALENSERTIAEVEEMLAEYIKRKEWFLPALRRIPGFECGEPEGAFYAFVDVRRLLGERFKSSADVAEHLLKEANVVVTDGAGFGAEGFLRISYAASMDTLRKAVERIEASLAGAATC